MFFKYLGKDNNKKNYCIDYEIISLVQNTATKFDDMQVNKLKNTLHI